MPVEITQVGSIATSTAGGSSTVKPVLGSTAVLAGDLLVWTYGGASSFVSPAQFYPNNGSSATDTRTWVALDSWYVSALTQYCAIYVAEALGGEENDAWANLTTTTGFATLSVWRPASGYKLAALAGAANWRATHANGTGTSFTLTAPSASTEKSALGIVVGRAGSWPSTVDVVTFDNSVTADLQFSAAQGLTAFGNYDVAATHWAIVSANNSQNKCLSAAWIEQYLSAASTLTGTGTATVAATRTRNAASTLAGTGTATVAATPKRVAASTLTGTGTATVAATPKRVAASTLTGTGTATVAASVVAGTKTHTVAVSLQASGAIAASGMTTRVGVVALQGTGDLATSASATHIGLASLQGSGTSIAAANRATIGTASLAAVGNAVADLRRTQTASIVLRNDAVLAVTPVVTVRISSEVAAASETLGNALVRHRDGATLWASGMLTAGAECLRPITSSLSGAGGTTTDSRCKRETNASLAGDASTTVAIVQGRIASVSLLAAGAASASATRQRILSTNLLAIGSISGAARITLFRPPKVLRWRSVRRRIGVQAETAPRIFAKTQRKRIGGSS